MTTLIFRLLLATIAAAGLLGCGKDPEVAKREYLDSGNARFAAQKYSEAIVEYRNALQLDPRFGEARHRLAESYLRQGDLRNATREYVRAADLLPDRSDIQLMAGGLLLRAGQFEDAKSRAEQVLRREPKNVAGQVLLANALAGLKEFDAAMTQIQEAVELAPEDARARGNLALLQWATGHKDQAEAAYRKALELDPKSMEANLSLANFYWATGRQNEAESWFKKTLELDPASDRAHRALAIFYIASNRGAEAEPHLKAMVERSKTADNRLALADYYVASNRPDEAVQILTAVSKEEPTAFVKANVRMARIQYARGDRDGAHATLREALKREANNPAGLVLKGQFLLREGDVTGALAQAQAAVAANPNDAPAHYLLGIVQARRSDAAAARAAFTEVLKLNPRSVAAGLRLADLERAAGDPAAAVRLATRATAAAPENVAAQLSLARSLMAQREFVRADAVLKPLLQKYPQAAAVHAHAGVLAASRKDDTEAAREFRRALELAPSHSEAVRGLVMLEGRAGRLAEARALVDAHLAKRPNDVVLLATAAEAYANSRDFPAAEKLLRRLIDADPANLRGYGMLGRLYLMERKLDSALTQFQDLARRKPDSVAAHTMVAMILQAQNKPEEARRAYERVLEIDGRAPVAANNLAYLYAETGQNLDVALQLAQTAKEGMPDNPEVNDTLGWIYSKKGLHTLAIPPLEDSVQRDPENPNTLYHLGVAYAGAGQAEKARQALERALRIKPDFGGSADARKVLQSVQGS